jgi:uncharacterized membrane protein YgaE (UPF0421/DUF939 family)
MDPLKAVFNYGTGGAVGLLVGILFAEWVGNERPAAYLLLVVLTVIVFALLGRFVIFLTARKKG